MARDRTDPTSYPETMEVTCPRCRQPYTSHRTGSGEPWRGGLDYWYTGDHDCPEKNAPSPSAALNKALLGSRLSDFAPAASTTTGEPT